MKSFQFEYQELASAEELDQQSAGLLAAAQEITHSAYAPYSHFYVGAAVLLDNGLIVKGVNVENASYPVGICAERAALSAVITSYPFHRILSIAISYRNDRSLADHPAFPCGMCRQFVSECEDRNQAPIRLILSGQQGAVFVIESAKHLLPFGFDGKSLG